jgi:hypothetical protein
MLRSATIEAGCCCTTLDTSLQLDVTVTLLLTLYTSDVLRLRKSAAFSNCRGGMGSSTLRMCQVVDILAFTNGPSKGGRIQAEVDCKPFIRHVVIICGLDTARASP